MTPRKLLSTLAVLLVAAACDRGLESGAVGNVNIRLTFAPQQISADDGTGLVVIDVDNFSGRPIRLEDVKVNTSAGFDKVGAIVANGGNRFTASLNGLTDTAQSPVQVTVSIGNAKQTGQIEVVPGKPDGLTLTVSEKAVSADVGEVDLTIRVLDKSDNLSPGAITLTTTAGVVSQLVNQPDGSYTAKLSGLVHTADSPVTVKAVAGKSSKEAVVQVLAGVLDHFDVQPIASPQVVGVFAPFYVSAHDKNSNVVTGFEEFVTVRTNRGAGDVEVSYQDSLGDYVPASTFTRAFELGVLPASPPEEFRIRTASATGITLEVRSADGVSGKSNSFTVDPAPANQLLIYTKSGFNLIVGADGCVKPTVAGPECLVGATTYPDTTFKQSPLATRLEMKLRRYVNSPDDPDGVAYLIGGRGADIEVTMTDADGNVFDKNSPTDGPYLGAVEDQQNGRYYVSVYNLRDQGKSPYTVTARYVSLVAAADVSVVPGDLHHFSFPETPAQRGGIAGIFFTSLTARDLWENQVFSFQETASVYVRVGNGAPQYVADAPPMLLGTTAPFATWITDSIAPATVRLWAQHGSGVTGQSNPFLLTTQVHTTTDFVVLLPGQYDNPPPASPLTFPFIGGNAALTPDIGQVSSTLVPLDQTSGQAFQVLVLARTRGLQVPVLDFGGKVLLTGVGTSLEVMDTSCASANAVAAESQGALTPNFLAPGLVPSDGRTWVGAGTSQLNGFESVCYVWVKAVGAGQNVSITADGLRSSGIPVSLNGNTSSAFRVRSAPAVSLLFDPIPSPQLGTANPNGGKNLFSFTVRGLDADGAPTDNVSCPSPQLWSNFKVGPDDPFQYTKLPAPKFDNDGVLRIDDAWFQINSSNPVNVQLTVDCGVAGMIATSNVFQVVSAGAVGYEFTLVPAKVKAHQSFTFSARACSAVDMSGKHCLSENDVARTFTYPVSMTDSTGTLVPGKTKSFVSGVLDQQTAMVDKVGSSRICLFAVGAYSCSDPFQVEYGDVSYFQFDMAGFPATITVGNSYDLNLAAYDAGGNKMPAFKGKIYLSNLTSSARFANNGLTSADVTTAVDGGDGKTKLFYCVTTDCASKAKLQVAVSEMSATDYFTVTDGRGHTGYSLPAAFRVVYGPVAKVDFEPCPLGTDIRRGAYFAVCATAKAWNAQQAAYVTKKDYDSTTDTVLSSPAVLPDDALPFVGGVAQRAFYMPADVSGGTYPFDFWAHVDGGDYPSAMSAFRITNTYAPIAYTITTASFPPAGLKVNQAFKLTLQVLNNGTGLNDSLYRGVLKVTDATNSIRPVCGAGQAAGSCGFLEGNTVVTGNLSGPPFGQRDQWFVIPTEYYGNYLWITDGFGQKVRVGPFDVQGNLKEFRFSALPPKIATGIYKQVTITAYDLDNNIMPNFKAPIQLQNRAQNINEVSAPLPMAIPSTAWTNGQATVSFRVPVANTMPDYLTASYGPVSTNSTNFVVEDPVLTSFTWDPIPTPQAGYVDFPVKLTARDQFNSLFLYSGTVNFTASNGYAIRPTVSGNFVNGVLGQSPSQLIAIDGIAGNNTVITATKTGGGAAGASNAVTVGTSTVVSFYAAFVTTTPLASFKANCTYPLFIQAVNAANGTGTVVSNFSGTAAIRWAYEDNLAGTLQFSGTVSDTTSFAPAVTAKFVGGQTTVNLTVKSQPAQGFFIPAALHVSPFVLGTGIYGLTTAFDLQAAGTCP